MTGGDGGEAGVTWMESKCARRSGWYVKGVEWGGGWDLGVGGSGAVVKGVWVVWEGGVGRGRSSEGRRG